MKLRKILSSIIAGAVAVSTMTFAASAAIVDTEVVIDDSWTKYGTCAAGVITEACTIEVKVKDVLEGAQLSIKETGGWTALDLTDKFTTDGTSAAFDTQWGVLSMSEDTTSIKVELNADDAKLINDGGAAFAGKLFTLVSVDFASADAEATEEAPAEDATAEAGAYTAELGYKDIASVKVVDDVTEIVAKVTNTAAGENGFEGMNDWCGHGVIVTLEDGTKTGYQFGGAQVNWDSDIDGDGENDSFGGVGGKTWLGAYADDAVELTIPVAKNAVVEIYCLSWDAYEGVQMTVAIDGGVVAYDASADAEAPAEDEAAEEAEDDAEDDAEEAEDDAEEAEDVAEEAEDDAAEDDAAPAVEVEIGDGSFAGTKYLVNNEAGKGTLYITAESTTREPNLSKDTGFDQTEVCGVVFYVDFDEAETENPEVWIGGGIGANSNSTGWLQNEWAAADKPCVADYENGTITWFNNAPIFAADDTYCQLWLHTWGGTVAVVDADLLDADGKVIEIDLGSDEEEAPAEDTTEEDTTEEAPAAGDVDAATDSSKGSPDTGVEDVAVVAGLAIVAAGAVLVSKKRK